MHKPNELTSQLSRVTHEAAATMLGQRGILRTLKGEHAELRSLLRACARTHEHPRGLTKRRTLFEEIRAQLMAHMETEEQELYANLAAIPEASGRVERDRRQHQGIDVLVQRLSLLDASTGEWMECMRELHEACDRHIDEEEGELFPMAMRHMSGEELDEMDRRYRREKQQRLGNLERELH